MLFHPCDTCKVEFIGPTNECPCCAEKRVQAGYINGVQAVLRENGKRKLTIVVRDYYHGAWVTLTYREWDAFIKGTTVFKISRPGHEHIWTPRNARVTFKLSDNICTVLDRANLIHIRKDSI